MADPIQRFLVIRLSSIGDIVHALPAVAALGDNYPSAEISWVVEKRYACLLDGNPFVRKTVTLDTLGWRGTGNFRLPFQNMWRDLSSFRAEGYDAAVDFQGLIKSGLIARLSRSKRRVGFSRPWLREPAAGVFYTERISPAGRQHVVELNFSLVEALGVRPVTRSEWKFPLPRTEADDLEVEQRLAGLGEIIVINPGGGWQGKRWPPENYAGLLRQLVRKIRHRILLTGSPAEASMVHEVLRQAECDRAWFFPSTLTQFIALARRASLCVGGDTGPVHLAAGVGTPVVAIFGRDPLNTPERNGPFNPDDIVVASKSPAGISGRRGVGYLSGVSVENVLEAICRRLDKDRG